MATFNLPAVSITANTLRTSPGVQPGANFNTAKVTLTDPNNDWPASPEQPFTLSGSVTKTSGSTLVTATGGAFNTQIAVGQRITIAGETRVVGSVSNNNRLNTRTAFNASAAGVTATRAPRHVLQWGFQSSPDNVNWDWGPVSQGDENDPATWLVFGVQSKDVSGMPSLAIDSSDFVGGTGTRLRLAILTDGDANLGATITTT